MFPLFLKFSSDNYTDHRRTPWAGRRIARDIKVGLIPNLPPFIGESWEFSASSELPSRCVGDFSGTLPELLADDARASVWLSEKHRALWGNGTPLLLKYIDAACDLSLQLHPPIECPDLPVGESGKWEAWLILKHDDNCGIYLGLARGVTREQFQAAVKSHVDLKPLLQFVPVEEGELYSIPPGAVHALGAGVCVLEPQIMRPGKRAVSLRLHDWNRLYDEDGNVSPNGMARPLHVEEALSYMDFDPARCDGFVNRCREFPLSDRIYGALGVSVLRPAPPLIMKVLSGSGAFEEAASGEITSIVVMNGCVEVQIEQERYALNRGESGVIAASARHVVIHCDHARVAVSYCVPDLYANAKESRL